MYLTISTLNNAAPLPNTPSAGILTNAKKEVFMSGKMFFQVILLIIIAAVVMSAAKYAMKYAYCSYTGKTPGYKMQSVQK